MGDAGKPKGIKVIAILILIFSGLALMSEIRNFLLIGLTSILLINTSGNDITSELSASLSHIPLTYLLITNAVLLVFDILFIIGAIGLLKYKKWGRKLVIYTSIGYLVEGAGNIVYLSIYAQLILTLMLILSFAASIVIYGLLLFYLNKKSVKKAFS